MIQKTFRIDGMHCTSCALMIESDLEDAGVKAHVSYAKQTLDVEFDEAAIDEAKIIAVVQEAGYRIV